MVLYFRLMAGPWWVSLSISGSRNTVYALKDPSFLTDVEKYPYPTNVIPTGIHK